MSLMNWRPRNDFLSVHNEMNHLFDNFFTGWPEPKKGLLEGEWIPSIDVAETDDNITVTAEIPGIKQEEVDIAITDDVLTLKGEKKEEKEIKEKNYCRIERSYGSFQRSVRLPSGVKGDEAKAAYKDGILTITIPKTEEVKPKHIMIDVD
jgi:HSP20 family protein